MKNWKKTVGLALFILSSIEFIAIKNHYHPHRSLRVDQLFSISALILTMALATILILTSRRNSSGG